MKRKLFNSFMILSLSTMISKLFSLINRMALSRLLSIDLFALYILILPTMSLCSILSNISIPSSVFRLVCHPHYQNQSIIKTALKINQYTCSIVCISICLLAHPISHILLKEPLTFYPILCFIPFIIIGSINSIIKNYFLGKERHMLLSIAQLFEEISRLSFSILLLLLFNLNNEGKLCIVILAMSVGELCSMGYLLYHIPSFNLHHGQYIYKDLLHISLPLTGSRLLHSLYNFIEPIILTSFLSMNKNDIHIEYAIISGYVISILFTPTFFNNVILRLIIPIFNQDLALKQYKKLQNHFLLSLLSSLSISLPFTCIYYFFPKECLYLIYHTFDGYQYLHYLAIPFTLCYLQTPMSALLQSLNKNKDLFILSILEIFIEILFLFILMPYYQVFSVAIIMLIGLISTLILSAYKIYFYVFKI